MQNGGYGAAPANASYGGMLALLMQTVAMQLGFDVLVLMLVFSHKTVAEVAEPITCMDIVGVMRFVKLASALMTKLLACTEFVLKQLYCC